MKNLDLWFGRPWALLPEKMDEIHRAVEARLAGAEISFDASRAGPSGNRADDSYRVTDGVAVIPVYGVLEKRANLFTRMSGGTSTELLARDLRAAFDDPLVDAVVLDIDSPGGAVDSVQVVVDALQANRARGPLAKPVVAHANELMASAAYWIGSAADRIVAAPTAQVGSIGVRMMHVDRSGMDEKVGVRRTEIFAGRYKTAGTDTRPLDEESRAYLQSRVDRFYTLFVEAVAANRGVTVAEALRWADGRVLIGEEAREAGLVDAIGNLETAIAMAQDLTEVNMTAQTLKEKHPEVYQAVFQEGAASVELPDVETIRAEARAEGAEPERARCRKLVEAHGPLDLTLEAIDQGTDPGEFALAVLKAEREGRAADVDRLAATLAPPVPPAGAAKPAEEPADFMAAVQAYREEHNVSLAEAVRKVSAARPDLHEQWLAEQSPARPQ